MKARLYKSGTKWCFWRWTEVPSDYILRLHFLKTPWFAICVHWINLPDQEPHLHDHPVTFLSIILRGGYTEIRSWSDGLRPALGVAMRSHRWFNVIRATPDDRHKIIHVRPNTVTLCFMGPKVREWGFHTSAGWIPWKQYNAAKYTNG